MDKCLTISYLKKGRTIKLFLSDHKHLIECIGWYKSIKNGYGNILRLPPFIIPLYRTINTSYPNYEIINSRRLHKSKMVNLIKEFRDNKIIYCNRILQIQLAREVYMFYKYKLPYELFVNIILFL